MATLTIKIDSDELARDVLAHLGYLPEDDAPDRASDADESPIIDAFKARMKTRPVVEEAPRAPKKGLSLYFEERLSEATRKMPETKKQNAFCTADAPKEGVEPVDNEFGASLDVYSDETSKEREEIRQQSINVRNSLPSAKDRLAAQIDELMGTDRLDYLDALAEQDDDKEMREAVKDYVIKEYTGHDLHLWPALHKILENARVQTEIQEHFNNVNETIRNVDNLLVGLRP